MAEPDCSHQAPEARIQRAVRAGGASSCRSEAPSHLLDFELAKITGQSGIESTQTMEGTLLGTAAYMSPEQAQGRPLDARSDVFSFGAVLYEPLSGRRAFSGDSFLETLNAVVSSEPPPLDLAIFPIVQRCLAKDPSQRFQSGAELREALREAVGRLSAATAGAEAVAQLRPSIAVLPFANMSGDSEQEYFSDGRISSPSRMPPPHRSRTPSN